MMGGDTEQTKTLGEFALDAMGCDHPYGAVVWIDSRNAFWCRECKTFDDVNESVHEAGGMDCRTCGGSGVKRNLNQRWREQCPVCGGSGVVTPRDDELPGMWSHSDFTGGRDYDTP